MKFREIAENIQLVGKKIKLTEFILTEDNKDNNFRMYNGVYEKKAKDVKAKEIEKYLDHTVTKIEATVYSTLIIYLLKELEELNNG